MQSNVDGLGTSVCKHCEARTGIGFYVFVQCSLRFNEHGFKKYLDFRNIGSSDNITYVKRLSDETFTRDELIEQFRSVCDPIITDKIVNEESYIDENRT